MPHLRYLSVELCNALVDRVQSTWPIPPAIRSWAPVSRFFDYLRLPAVEQVDVELASRPTEQEFKSLLATLPGTCNHQSLIDIHIHTFETVEPSKPVPDPQYISFHHLSPLTVFVNIRAIRMKLPRGVDLSEQELLQLALSWPRLEEFNVGRNDAEIRALTTGQCRSLSHFSFPFNTHGYTEVHQGHPWHGLKLPDGAVIDVGVSPIEEDSIETLGIFFHVAPFPQFRLYDDWDDSEPMDFEEHPELVHLFSERWERVRSLACKHWMERDSLLSSLRNRGQHCA
ncbi:hypothetical protein JVT61DRAFT_8948 [Boletus reticuloceps]|uniref:Uncharacterized protein n=1 Tax=Boletus reticuloceps TaxID=495285 RepID=A0A8I2YHL9_9AGAM|nr:hypothetical protein JVT61DRAFT_8948 [Boletus reticuloceps]